VVPALVALLALLVAGALLIFLAVVSPSRPRAPALVNEPVYHNAREGFRFLAPEEWTVTARGESPPGHQDKERLLVSYQRSGTGKPARFEVTLADLPPSTDLAVHLASPSYGSEKWQLKTQAEALDLKGVAATRYAFFGHQGKDEMSKEVVAVRRGERVFFLVTIYSPGDVVARDEVRRAVASTIWE
jgi:hypothetical protein